MSIHVKPSPVEDRLKIWQENIVAEKSHIGVGEQLQRKAYDLLAQIDTIQDIEKQTKFLAQATMNLEKGIKIVREARERLRKLHEVRPQ